MMTFKPNFINICLSDFNALKVHLLSYLFVGFAAIVSSLSAQTVIGGSTPDPSALLDVQSINKGVLLPRMTTTERNAISNPATGLMIFNTTTECLEINLGTSASPTWTEIKCPRGSIASLDADNSRLTGSVLMPSVAASMNSARVPYTGGDGKDYDGQSVSSTGVTGLTATLAAGTFAVGDDSLTLSISGTPIASGLAIFVLNIGGQMSTLKVPVGCGAYVAANTWKVFSCHNLGAANTTVDPFAPSWEINGDYWQWGVQTKAADGPADASTHNEGSVTGWNTTTAGNGAWQDGSKTGTDPCPTGFRVPTENQWEGVINNNLLANADGSTWNNSISNYTSGKKFGSNLMLPAAGNRANTDGQLFRRGADGFYWCSTEDSGNSARARTLFLDTNNPPYMTNYNRARGQSIRCIAE